MKKMFQDYGYQWINYSNLVQLRSTYTYYEEVLENLYEVDSLSKLFGTLPFLSESTKDKMKAFENKWYSYNEEVSFSSDTIFVFLDKRFIDILDHELYEFLISFSRDIRNEGYQDALEIIHPSKLTMELPGNATLIKRIDFLYKDFIIDKL